MVLGHVEVGPVDELKDFLEDIRWIYVYEQNIVL